MAALLVEARKLAPAAILFAIGEGNQLSGKTIPWLSEALFVFAGLAAIIWIWPHLTKWRPFSGWKWQLPIARWMVPVPELYVGKIMLGIDQLSTAHSLELTIVGFNGTKAAVSVDGVSGHADFLYEATIGSMPSMGNLPTPTLVSAISQIFAPGAEFVIILKQPLPPNMAQQAIKTLAEGLRIQLDLRQLEIRLSGAKGYRERLPLWDGVGGDTKPNPVLSSRMVMATGRAEGRAEARVG